MRGFGMALAAAFTLVSIPASASEWWYVNSGPGRVVFVDAQSVERRGDVATYWTMYVIRPGEPEVMSKSRRRVRCGKRRIETLETLRYDEKGRAIGDVAPPAEPVQVGAPDTLGDAEMRFACGDEGHRVVNDLFPLAVDEVAFAEALIARGNRPADAHDLHEAMAGLETAAPPSGRPPEEPVAAPYAVDIMPAGAVAPAPADEVAAEIRQLEGACAGGVAGSCAELGKRFAQGDGVGQDPARAATFYDKACAGGEPDGCTYLGIAYHEGSGVAPSPERATIAFTRACELGGAAACGNLGLALVKGEGTTKDVQRAFAYFDAACEAGNAASCSSLGAAYSLGVGVRHDARRARRLFEKACDGDDAGGCYNLGVVYDQGLGVRKDRQRAAGLYIGACERDDGAACGNLGTLVQNGTGIAMDAARAAALFRKSCDLGDADGCLNLGRVYQAGSGVERDREQAGTYYRRSLEIEPGKAEARRALADLMPG